MKIFRLDASALVKSSCKLRLKRIITDGITEGLPYNDTQYGSAFHLFCKVIHTSNGNIAEATNAALELFAQPCVIRKKHLTPNHLVKTCHDYWIYAYQKDDFEIAVIDGKPLVEQTFSIKYLEGKDQDDEEYQVYLEGTIDKVGKFKSGIPAIGDYKTHSLFALTKNPNGIQMAINEYFCKFELSLQLRFYVFCIKYLMLENPEHSLSQIFKDTKIGSFIDGVFLDSKEPTRFERSNVWAFDYNEIETFGTHLLYIIHYDILPVLMNDNYNLMDGLYNGSCSDGNFLCQYFKICAQPNEQIKNLIIQNNYTKRPYEPLKHGKKEFVIPQCATPL